MEKIRKSKLIKIISTILIVYIIFYIIAPAGSNVSFARTKASGIGSFPASYQPYLEQLQALHPNWTFTALNTGLDWNTVIYNETTARHGRNLVQGKSSEWICSTCGTKAYDGTSWYDASDAAVKYMMDPRNMLNELYIFQFEALSYVSGVHTVEGIEKILEGTFMHNTKANYKNSAGTTIACSKTYAQLILEAGQEQGISPYFIASRIRQELGTTAGAAASGTTSGYLGIYNFYNIGATDGANAVLRGLYWASTDTTYGRPWTSPEKSIKGGAQFLASGYINKGQDTLYTQKFDVDDSDKSLYSHQYMTNCLAPYNECRTTFSTYLNNGLLNNNFNFIIPVYNNMPAAKSPNPSAVEHAGCTAANTVVYGANLSSGSAVNIRTGPGTGYGVISYAYNGTPMVRIGTFSSGWSKVMIASGAIGYISNDYLTTTKPVTQLPAPGTPVEPIPGKFEVKSSNFMLEPTVNLKEIKAKYADVVITDENNKPLGTDDLVGTGCKIKTGGKEYTVIKLGDVDGDGDITSIDMLRLQRYLLDLMQLNNNYISAANVLKSEDGPSSVDLLKIQRYILGVGTLEL